MWPSWRSELALHDEEQLRGALTETGVGAADESGMCGVTVSERTLGMGVASEEESVVERLAKETEGRRASDGASMSSVEFGKKDLKVYQLRRSYVNEASPEEAQRSVISDTWHGAKARRVMC